MSERTQPLSSPETANYLLPVLETISDDLFHGDKTSASRRFDELSQTPHWATVTPAWNQLANSGSEIGLNLLIDQCRVTINHCVTAGQPLLPRQVQQLRAA